MKAEIVVAFILGFIIFWLISYYLFTSSLFNKDFIFKNSLTVKNLPFTKVGSLVTSEKALLILKGVKNKDIWLFIDIEKAKISIKYQPGLEGTLFDAKIGIWQWLIGSNTVSEITIKTGFPEDVIKWNSYLDEIKKELKRKREEDKQPKRVVPGESGL
jgi:hypothetical protein